eukprot:177551_1
MALQIIFVLVVLLTITQGTQPDNQPGNKPDSDPICSKANLPFMTETEARKEVEQFVNCSYEFWKVDSPYHGKKGHEAVYGKDNYIFNESTIWLIDGQTRIDGLDDGRKSAIKAKHFASAVRPTLAEEIEVLEWSHYSVYFKYKTHAMIDIGRYKGSEHTYDIFANKTWFKDNSGIVKTHWQNSANSVEKDVLNGLITTTESIANTFGYDIEDDHSNYYIQNPLQFVFMCLLSLLTAFIAIGVYILLKCVCKTRGTIKKLEMIKLVDSDENEQLNQSKNQ